ncbi:hypothetical protein HWI79_1526 [Cryptosporidium felis]|nr:hypothetical protein HWI79_1526 [Cryptosporidium felis]
MDPVEFKHCFPNVKFRFFGVGKLHNYKLFWNAKGIPFLCRKRPTLMPLSGAVTYGVIIKLTHCEKTLIREYIKFLPNNRLVEADINLYNLHFKNIENDEYLHLKKSLIVDNKDLFSSNETANTVRANICCAELHNLLLDKSFLSGILKSGAKDLLHFNYFKNIDDLYLKIKPTFPSEDYVYLLRRISEDYQLPKEYIEENFSFKERQKLNRMKSLMRRVVINYMYIITLMRQQEIGLGIIDLLWELDPHDPLVFEDYGNANIRITIFIVIIVLLPFLIGLILLYIVMNIG